MGYRHASDIDGNNMFGDIQSSDLRVGVAYSTPSSHTDTVSARKVSTLVS